MKVLNSADESILEMWMFWRIVILGKESFVNVDKLTIKEIVEYNKVLDIKDQITEIIMNDLKENMNK